MDSDATEVVVLLRKARRRLLSHRGPTSYPYWVIATAGAEEAEGEEIAEGAVEQILGGAGPPSEEAGPTRGRGARGAAAAAFANSNRTVASAGVPFPGSVDLRCFTREGIRELHVCLFPRVTDVENTGTRERDGMAGTSAEGARLVVA
ncbi:unnamed protein product [Pylaiella littoralis]